MAEGEEGGLGIGPVKPGMRELRKGSRAGSIRKEEGDGQSGEGEGQG